MIPQAFNYKGNEYRSVARAKGKLLALRDLDSCCREWLCLASDKEVFKILGVKSKIRLRAIYSFTLDMYNDVINDLVEKDSFKFDDITVPAFKPTEVKGTSGDVPYRTLIITDKGIVSHRGDKELINNPRIRIAKDNHDEDWKVGSLKLSSNANWETVAKTHLAQTADNPDSTKVLIARGLDAIFQLEAI